MNEWLVGQWLMEIGLSLLGWPMGKDGKSLGLKATVFVLRLSSCDEHQTINPYLWISSIYQISDPVQSLYLVKRTLFRDPDWGGTGHSPAMPPP